MITNSEIYGPRSPRPVWVYTLDCVYAGLTHLYRGEHLLDFLNDATARDKGFLQVESLRLWERSAASQESALSVAVNVHQILLAWEAGAKPQVGPEMTRKRSIAVRLGLQGQLVVLGILHCAPAESVVNMLHRRERFLPLTDVHLSPATWDGVTSLPFLAVNKEYLVSVREVAIAAVDAGPGVLQAGCR
ncbi:MAG: hypothetical protein HYX94_01090 [Chloroflexi bacterium]|nr:hypothetical protein [Chloroflexota bacterium]